MAATDPDIEIRPARTPADFRACQAAQKLAWGVADDRDLIPVATMTGAQHHGGLVLGAFRPDGSAVALSFAFLGRAEGRPCLYSQLTGVVPGHQGAGLGVALKTIQRAYARDQGIPCLAWTFDPLQAGNARFNLARLGATAGRYAVDLYGPRSDALNRDTPTDRLFALWESAEAPARPSDPSLIGRAPRLIDPDGPAFLGLPGGPRLLLEIPAAVNALRAEGPGLARAWGLAVRAAFLAAFGDGYRAVSFLDGPDGRGFYLLEGSSLTAAELMQ